jgi:hypothetical protein
MSFRFLGYLMEETGNLCYTKTKERGYRVDIENKGISL